MSDIEEVKRRVDIVDLIGSYVTLKKAGKDYKALCPFHKEKTPSFFVSPEKQIFKCFGCGEGGDVFDFLMKQEGLEFGDALKVLADRAGVTLTPRTGQTREQPGVKSRLFALNRLSALFYHKILREHPSAEEARRYLRSRGVTEETIRTFWIGYAPSQGPLTTFLTRRGYTASDLEQAGRPDRFARRIIFPILDVVGNVVGFSGRVLSPHDEPKYLNTPETSIFRKGHILYGLYQAKKAIREADRVIVAEGQMDVILSHQAGVPEAVATSGIALTGDHLSLLLRYTPNLYLAFDTDPAGERAAARAILAALAAGFTVRLIPLAEKDPADLVKTDPALWRSAVSQATEAISYIIDRSSSKYPATAAEQKKAIAKEVLPYLAALPDPIEQETWVHELARRLSVSDKTIYLALAKVRKAERVTVIREVAAKKSTRLTPAETLIGLLLAYPHKGERVVKELEESSLPSERLRLLFRTAKEKFAAIKSNPASARATLAKVLPPDLLKLTDFLVLEVSRDFTEAEEAAAAMKELLLRVDTTKSELLKREFAAKIAQAEASGDREQVKRLMQEFQRMLGTQPTGRR